MQRQALIGGLFALLAFGSWGFNPIYFKAVGQVPVLEVLAHRVLWSVPLLALLVFMAKSWPAVRRALTDRRTLLILFCTTVTLSLNWFFYILAINSDRVLESSLAYYINPLLNVVLGMVFLKERLSRWQGIAVALAGLGVLNLVVQHGTLPWIALVLAGTFALYGLLRKVVQLGSVEGLLIETGIMLPVALGYTAFLGLTGAGFFMAGDWTLTLLIALAGPVSTLPLIWFNSGVTRLNYATIGIFQYIAPTCHFLLAVFVYDEPFGTARLVTFACVWTALAIFTTDTLHRMRREARATAAA